MSKPVKNLITESYKKKFKSVEGAVIIDVRGIPSNTNNKLRNGLAAKKIKVTVVKNSLAKRAFEQTALKNIAKYLEGPTGIVHGGESVVDIARVLVDMAKDMEVLKFKGALMDGVLFGPEQIKDLSKYPTKVEALSQTVTLIFSPGRNVAASILGPGRKIGSLVKAIEERAAKSAEASAAPAAEAPAATA